MVRSSRRNISKLDDGAYFEKSRFYTAIVRLLRSSSSTPAVTGSAAAYEQLLGKYDPGTDDEKEKNPLAAHYWQWEDGVYDATDNSTENLLPSFLTDEMVEIFEFNDSGERTIVSVPNPILYGVVDTTSCMPSPISRDYQWSLLRNIKGMVTRAMAATTYSEFTSPDGANSLYIPQTLVRLAIGGNTTSLQSSWDPIYWLYLSNVERLHFIWLERYKRKYGKYPTTLPADPFPEIEFLPSYDVLLADDDSIFNCQSSREAAIQSGALYLIRMTALNLNSSGILEVTAFIDGIDVVLEPRPFIITSDHDRVDLICSWEVNFTEVGINVNASHYIELVTATFNGEYVTGNLSIELVIK